jgi:sugar phosphate isomerase/epimerase
MNTSRRDFLRQSMALGAAAMSGPLALAHAPTGSASDSKMKVGLCTYLWGQNWDLPTVIANCAKAGIPGVELRTEHKHGVEPGLSAQGRAAVKKRFADSPITLVGFGSNECFDNPDPQRLKRSIEAAKAFVRLSHDCGGSGVKVKPNDFHKNVPHEKTIEQIGKSLNVLGRFAADLGQQIRLEVHGSCQELPVMKQIIELVDQPNVGLCWNCNGSDIKGQGLAYNFDLVKDRLGATTHIHELNSGQYPYSEFIGLLVKADYAGWMLLECHTSPKDGVAAMIQQKALFEKMVAAVKRWMRYDSSDRKMMDSMKVE